MSVMNEMRNIKQIAENVLLTNANARDDNDLLYLLVCKEYAEERGYNLENMTFFEVLKQRKQFKLPAYESVARERRKIVEEDRVLLPSDDIQAWRELRQGEFTKWAIATKPSKCP